MKRKEKILLLTDVFPCKNYSGAILSLQLSHFIREENYSLECICIKHKDTCEIKDDEIESEVPCLYLEKPLENHESEDVYNNKLNKIYEKVVNYIKSHNIDIIWCPIQGETILRVLNNIQNKCKNIKIVAQIWDPIEWVLYDLKYPEDKSKELLKMFDKVMNKCSGILTGSEYMSEEYNKKYNKKTYPSYISLDLKEYPKQEKSKDEFVIVMAGQTYASTGIDALVNALNNVDWKINDKKVVLKYFGSNMPKIFNGNDNIICMGFVPQTTLILEETKADLLYCSYFFEDHPALKKVSCESFPSKVTSYIPAGVPILIHSYNDASVYRLMNKYKAAYLLDELDEYKIINELRTIIKEKNSDKANKIVENAKKMFLIEFSKKQNKENLFKALNLPYDKNEKHRLLEVNYVDLPGKSFNGYDLMNELNDTTNYSVNMISTYKTSNNNNVVKLYNGLQQELEYMLLDYEANNMFLHSTLSIASPVLVDKDVFKNSNMLHVHMIHNTKLSLISLLEICNTKPTVITIHDPWTFTGRCVHYEDCKKYLTGCKNCENLDTLFTLKKDNCDELWNTKKFVYDNIDVDYVVTSKYMLDLFNKSPLTKGKRVHLIPLGIDLDRFSTGVTSDEARKYYKINKDDIVIFHRAQKAFKGTEYLLEALKILETDKNITIITCSEEGHFDDVKNKYNVIDLGNIGEDELRMAYNACDIFLMPSIGESFGMMAIEAMSCSKPVIVFDNTALPSVTHAPECGIAVENKNSEKLMEAIKLLVENEQERLKRGKLAREIAEKEYGINIYNQRMKKLYDEASSRKHDFSGKEILKKEIKDTKDVYYTKVILNRLSYKLFSKNSEEFIKMYYEVPYNIEKEFNKDIKIKYSDINVQLLINEYNNNLYKYYKTSDSRTIYPGIYKLKVVRMTRRFFELLFNDRKLLKKTIKRKLHIKE